MELLWPVPWDKSLLLARSKRSKATSSASLLPSQHYLPRQGRAMPILWAQQVKEVWGGRDEHAEKHVRPDNLRRH